MTPGRQGSESKALTMQSECMPWRTLARVQFSPSSGLIITPCPMVPTRMVPFFAMVHPLRSCGRSRLLRWRLYARRRAAATRSTHSHARRASYAGLAPLSRVPVYWRAITVFQRDADPYRMDQVLFWFALPPMLKNAPLLSPVPRERGPPAHRSDRRQPGKTPHSACPVLHP